MTRLAISRTISVIVIIAILVVGISGYLVLTNSSTSTSSSATTGVGSSVTSLPATLSPKQGGTLTIAYDLEQINNFDPAATTRGDFSDTVIQNVYEGLVIYNYNHQIVPDLAVSWTLTNSTTYVFKLRQNV